MKSALFAVCLIGVTLLGSAEAQAQVIGVGVPLYGAPVYAAPVYPTTVYSVPAYATTGPVYYPAPGPVYAMPAPYALTAPVVVGAPVRVYGHWGRHHVHLHYRW